MRERINGKMGTDRKNWAETREWKNCEIQTHFGWSFKMEKTLKLGKNMDWENGSRRVW